MTLIISGKLRRQRAEAGKKGGYATLFRYGRDKMAEWGSLGGRPRLLTLSEMKAQQSGQPGENMYKEERLSNAASKNMTPVARLKYAAGAGLPARSRPPEGAHT